MTDIWTEVEGHKQIQAIMAYIYRFVESQEQSATLQLVNTIYEQEVLENLLESSKSEIPEHIETLHYLLKTPFRYPPLKFGSRFGTSFERGIFYGSLNLSTALAETAYYRFVYLLGPEIPFAGSITSEFTSFSISVKSALSILLDETPFSNYTSVLCSPNSYAATQLLGTHMREHGVEIFRFISARDHAKGKNIGLFSPNAFHQTQPTKTSQWLCQTTIDEVGFISKDTEIRMLFKQKDFWAEGVFPSFNTVVNNASFCAKDDSFVP